jgi:hypothetical protein
MPSWNPMVRTAFKVAPIAFQVARKLDRQVRPHLRAYRLAHEVDGFVAGWTSDHGPHWIVFARRNADPLRSFPPLPSGELDMVGQELDRSILRHHSELMEAKVRERTSRVVDVSSRVAGRRRGDDDPPPSPAMRLPPPER